MLKNLLSQVAAPGAAFRGAPFWAWNSKLEPEELRRQIRIFKQMGLGGFFMHARVGLGTPYLSPEWFRCIGACVDEAKKLGLDAWLYDEDRWPSGAAGSLVTREVRYREQGLYCAEGETAAALGDYPAENTLAIYEVATGRDSRELLEARPLARLPRAAAKGRRLAVVYWKHDDPSSWFNGAAYLDTMNPEAVRKFIDVTHEAYLKRCGGEFGKAIPGIFTDEPCYNHSGSHGEHLPWTGRVPAEFRKRKGYDLVPHLLDLFFNRKGEEFSRVRHDFYEVCTALFTEAFSKQIGEWCAAHGLDFTGHVLLEDSLTRQRKCVGSAMRFYEYMQVPGIDLLTEHWDVVETAKQCTSVAHQFGMPRRMCETYGCTGWDFPFAGHKGLGDWLAVLGINFRVLHLAWYTMAAEAKRDYPASISFQSSWHPHYATVEDYFAHLNAALSEGEEIRDILVVHPVESCWGWKARPTDEECDAYDRTLMELHVALLDQHLDFDYGDEEHLARLASVRKGAAPELRVGKAAYRAVVVPALATIRATTLKLLQAFAKAGGVVLHLGEPPAHLDGKPSDAPARAFAAFRRTDFGGLAAALAPVARRVSVADGPRGGEFGPVLYLLKEGAESTALFLTNTAIRHEASILQEARVAERQIACEDARIRFRTQVKGAKYLYELDLTSGAWRAFPAAFRNGEVSLATSFAPLESHFFLATAKPIPGALPAQAPFVADAACELPSCCLEYRLDEPNALVLDQARYWVDGEASDQDVHYILRIDDDLRRRLGHEPRGGAMVQPWMVPANQKPERTVRLKLEFTFECEELPPARRPLFLAVERPDLYDIRLNGVKVPAKDVGEWVDPAIRRLKVPARALREGLNRLTLEGDYHVLLPGLEAVYLLGDFGVRGARTITALPDDLELGDWCEQGLPNYAGQVTYICKFALDAKFLKQRLALHIPYWCGTALGISVNGSPMRILGWPPYTLEITDQLKPGRNTLAVTVMSSRRNAFGPFYCEQRQPLWVGSYELKSFQVTERSLVPCGIMLPLQLQAMKPTHAKH